MAIDSVSAQHHPVPAQSHAPAERWTAPLPSARNVRIRRIRCASALGEAPPTHLKRRKATTEEPAARTARLPRPAHPPPHPLARSPQPAPPAMRLLPVVLALLPATALASPLYMSVPENRIMKAGDFKRYQLAAERDAINIILAGRASRSDADD